MNALWKAFLRKVMPCLLLPVALAGCWSYISTEAHSRFQGRTSPVSVTIFPVNVVKGRTLVHDAALAQKLAALLQRETLADAVAATAPAKVTVEWGMNQARMAQRSAKAFAALVQKSSIQTDYALLAEILCNPDETQVLGVHYYLSDRNGQLADGGLANSHWDDFQQVLPRDRQGGYEVLVRMLRANWKRG